MSGHDAQESDRRTGRWSARSASHSRDRVLGQRLEHRLEIEVDRPITLSSSLVAVCCSSATRSSLLRASSSVNSRTFSMAITAWSAKVLRSAICVSEKGPRLAAPDDDGADRPPSAQHRHGRAWSAVAMRARSGVRVRRDRRRRPGCGRRPVRTARPDVCARRSHADTRACSGSSTSGVDVVVRGELEQLAVEPDQTLRRRRRTAAPRSRTIVSKTGWTSVGELAITRRISPVAVCCSSASVSSRVPRLQLREQAHVLDGDDRLVGEGLQQRDLLVGERPDLVPVDR